MSGFDWSDEKNEVLERTRGVCFEEVLVQIEAGHILDVIALPDLNKYPGQRFIVIDIDGYVWLVPYVKSGGTRFLKTIIPSRKATREYLS